MSYVTINGKRFEVPTRLVQHRKLFQRRNGVLYKVFTPSAPEYTSPFITRWPTVEEAHRIFGADTTLAAVTEKVLTMRKQHKAKAKLTKSVLVEASTTEKRDYAAKERAIRKHLLDQRLGEVTYIKRRITNLESFLTRETRNTQASLDKARKDLGKAMSSFDELDELFKARD